MFSSIRMIFAILLITGIAGAGMYVMKLRSDNAILKANQLKLETAVAEQNKVLEKQKKDFEAIKIESGGPKIVQHKNAIKQSAATITIILFLLDRFLSIDASLFILVILL